MQLASQKNASRGVSDVHLRQEGSRGCESRHADKRVDGEGRGWGRDVRRGARGRGGGWKEGGWGRKGGHGLDEGGVVGGHGRGLGSRVLSDFC